MDAGVLRSLLDALDGHITLMRDLVALAQREQRHLIAFEPIALAACTDDKRALAVRLGASEEDVRELVGEAAASAGLPPGEPVTVRTVAARVAESQAGPLLERADCLRALAESLKELQSMSLVQAERGLRLVDAYAALLRSSDPTIGGPGTYDAKGRSVRDTPQGGTLSRSI